MNSPMMNDIFIDVGHDGFFACTVKQPIVRNHWMINHTYLLGVRYNCLYATICLVERPILFARAQE